MEFFDLEFDLDLGDELSRPATKRIKNDWHSGTHLCNGFRKTRRKCKACVTGGVEPIED